jgi:ubiquinone/menaquinone biosynthesis C-methylase UbiE
MSDDDTYGPSRKEIWKMFDQISPTYDCVNRIMTFGLDQLTLFGNFRCLRLPLQGSKTSYADLCDVLLMH